MHLQEIDLIMNLVIIFCMQKFFLAGSQRSSGQSQHQHQHEHGRERGRRGEEGEQEEKSNIFSGFDEELLADAFNLEPEVIRRLQAREDNRGFIVRAERLQLLLPEYGREEQEREQQSRRGSAGGNNIVNGLEETFCSQKIRQNIDHPTRADVFNPRGGRLSTLNSQTLPILSYLRLSAERGVLYRVIN